MALRRGCSGTGGIIVRTDPRIVIGLLCTTDGIPRAHHVFAGNTYDASTLAGVLDDLAKRFAVRRVDRGLVSASNLETVARAGFDKPRLIICWPPDSAATGSPPKRWPLPTKTPYG